MTDADPRASNGTGTGSEVEQSAEQAGVSSDASAWSVLYALALVAAVVVALYFGLWPGHVPTPRNPSFGDNVFASAPVVFAARLILLSAGVVLAFGGVFVIASIIKLWKAGRWLTRFGPFEAAPEAIGTLADEVEKWRADAVEQFEAAQELRQRLQEADELLDTLLSGEPKPPD